jgi:uncharacterized membrane protein
MVAGPGRLREALDLSAYVPFYGELVVFGIGVAAVTLGEGIEYFLSRKPVTSSSVRTLILLLLSILLILIVVASVWFGRFVESRSQGQSVSLEDVAGILWLNFVVILLSWIIKWFLWSFREESDVWWRS